MGLGIRHPAIASTASEINNAPTPCLTGLIFNYPIRPFEGVEQPTAQEPSIPEAEFRTTVDRRFSGVNVRIVFGRQYDSCSSIGRNARCGPNSQISKTVLQTSYEPQLLSWGTRWARTSA